LAWRISGTLKKYGDKRTTSYFLNNTGVEEANFSVQLEKSLNDKLFLDFYASTFNTKLGVLRGSHIGNLTDLEQALEREIPFFTETAFSYVIEAPKQQVSHHLLKAKAKYLIKENETIVLIAAGQVNDRKEFDVRRNDRTDIPALSLLQFTLNTEAKYTKKINNTWEFKLGNQNVVTDNTNNPETGILPLIPDYFSWKNGVFGVLSKRIRNVYGNIGARYDYERQSVVAISRGLPRTILRYTNYLHNVSAMFALKYHFANAHTILFNSGYATRNPGINERYSNGLHQGVSGIEEGDVDLKTENAVKNTLEYTWLPSNNFSAKVLAYHQYFKNYIFLNPQNEFRLTIRGAFPVFKYEQTNASIYGLDVSTQFTISDAFDGQINYNYTKGTDLNNNSPLILMPPNKLFGSIVYRTHKPIKLSHKLSAEELEIGINNRLVFEQKNLLEQDFVPPPPRYNLVGIKLSTNMIFPHYKIRAYLKADNLLNVQYRDYLNRQRYFADDMGISITMGISAKF